MGPGQSGPLSGWPCHSLAMVYYRLSDPALIWNLSLGSGYVAVALWCADDPIKIPLALLLQPVSKFCHGC
jgi:hypothetical protein